MKSVKKVARAGQHVCFTSTLQEKRQKYEIMCNIKYVGRMERRDRDERIDGTNSN